MLRPTLLLINVLVIAICGLVYELVAGALASYVLGDSVTQFSTCIGVYLFAMGIGAWLSGFVTTNPSRVFVEVELAVALIGGFSAPLLFAAFSSGAFFRPLLYGLVLVIGTLVGLELPLLMRILKESLPFKDLVSRVLTFDYVGALVASLAFPLFLVPQLGLIRTSLVFGLANGLVGLWGTWLLADEIRGATPFLRVRSVVVLVVLAVGLIRAESFTRWSEDSIYERPILAAVTSPYQRIVVTGDEEGFQLFLGGHLQFSSVDEYRYHEALVHPAISAFAERGREPRRALVLGGGDGLAIRELLRSSALETITLVDLDPEVTRLASEFPPLVDLNRGALSDPRVTVVNDDAMIWLEFKHEPYDVVVIDFPDPNSYSLGKLYTTAFFRRLKTHLHPESMVSIQATSPIFTRRSYWCIVRTMEAVGLQVHPYHAAVPSFGIWGFALASPEAFEPPGQLSVAGLRFLDAATMQGMFAIPRDLGPLEVEIQRLDNQILVQYHDAPRVEKEASTTAETSSSEASDALDLGARPEQYPGVLLRDTVDSPPLLPNDSRAQLRQSERRLAETRS